MGMSGTEGYSGEVELCYHFEVGEEVETLMLQTRDRVVPSLFALFATSEFPEREAARRFRIRFAGHPDREESG